MDWPRPRTALLVDDSAIVRERLMQLAERIPGLVVVAQCEDAECALSSLDQVAPDIMLLDIRLRAGGGMRLLRHAAQHHPLTRVVVLTNQADEQTRRICLRNGAHQFVDKSSDLDRLPHLLGELVRQYHTP